MDKHTAVYLRVSTKVQDTASQEPDLKRTVTQYDDGPVVWYRDKFTGKTMDRPAWSRLETALNAGKVTRIVVWRLDRLGRTAKGLTALFDEMVNRKVNLVSLKDGLDLVSSAGRLMANVLASVAQYETEVRGAHPGGSGSRPNQGEDVGGRHQGEANQGDSRARGVDPPVEGRGGEDRRHRPRDGVDPADGLLGSRDRRPPLTDPGPGPGAGPAGRARRRPGQPPLRRRGCATAERRKRLSPPCRPCRREPSTPSGPIVRPGRVARVEGSGRGDLNASTNQSSFTLYAPGNVYFPARFRGCRRAPQRGDVAPDVLSPIVVN